MGCGASSERPTALEPVAAKAVASKAAAEKTAVAEATAKAEEKGAAKKKATTGVPAALVAIAAATAPNFELSTPMLVSPFLAFEEQGRICKSTKPWRDKALADGSLLPYDKLEGGGSGRVVDGRRAADSFPDLVLVACSLFVACSCLCS